MTRLAAKSGFFLAVVRPLLVLVAVVALIGLILYSQWRPPPRKVSGYVEAYEIRLGSQVGGRVAEVLFDEGDRVRKDQVVVRLEPFDLLEKEREAQALLAAKQAELDELEQGFRVEEQAQAKARHDQLKARLEMLVNGPREQEIESARAHVTVAEAELKLAKSTFERSSSLLATGALTREELDRDTERLQAAEAMLILRQQQLALLEIGTRPEELDEARAKLDEAREAWELTKAGYRQEEIQRARAARDAARAAHEALQRRLSELEIRSPVDGTVEALELRPGDLVPVGAPAFSVLDDRTLWIRAYVPQRNLGLSMGQEMRVTIDAFPDEEFAGKLEFVARQAEFSPSNVQTYEERAKQVFRVKVRILAPRGKLRPGMTGDVWLPVPGGDR